MKLERLIFVALMLLLLLHPAQAEGTPTVIYYVADGSIYQIVDGQNTPEIVASDLPSAGLFSNNGRWIAYMNDVGLWISDVANWEPHLVLEEKRAKYGWMWTPDDTRFILSAASSFSAENGPEAVDTYAFNTQTGEIEKWGWGNCNRVARHNQTLRVALICSSESEATPSEVALYWGGNHEPYHPAAYKLLLDEFYNFQPVIPFDWQFTEAGDHFVYLARNPDFSFDDLDADEPVMDIFWLEGSGAAIRINSSVEEQPEQLLAVSPDRTMVAHEISCVYRFPRECLVVANLNTGQVVRNFRDVFYMRSARDIVWFPDNKRVALLGDVGKNYPASLSIWVADIVIGKVTEYPLGNPAGNICCIAIPR